MFGLMRHGARLPYCGTCKTLGAMYGQRARLLLNNDTVFLAEVLLDFSGEKLAGEAYQSYNCLRLPRETARIPLAMQYAAAITVVLAYFRIEDHRQDAATGRRRLAWRLGARVLSREFRQAAALLRGWEFPLDEISAILATQPLREARRVSLGDVAEPTSSATALVFSHGVRLAGRPDQFENAWRLGAKFGELIYLLDAFEDRERDARGGDFNPMIAFGISVESMRERILETVRELERKMTPAHALRLRINVEERLGLRPRVLQEVCRESLRQRALGALAFARSMRDRENAGWFKGAVIVASVALVAFAVPHQARHAESWQQCMGLSMNVMALGAVLGGSAKDCGRKVCGGCGEACAETCIEGICESICG